MVFLGLYQTASKKMSDIEQNTQEAFYRRICDILSAARTGVARTVNTAQVLSNWLIGREIVEAEQEGKHRADYGENLLKNLAQQLKQDFGAGYSYPNLKLIRQFYLAFPQLLSTDEIGYALRSQSLPMPELSRLSQSDPSWQPGRLHPNLSWTHYRTLMRVDQLIDLVFYHTILKCYILIDLKVGKLTHGDLGQLQLYVNYYD